MSVSVVIASPICQKAKILEQFLISLEELEVEGIEVSYLFVDDNHDEVSKILLRQFEDKHQGVNLLEPKDICVGEQEKYVVDDYTHRWNDTIVAKVTQFKNAMIEKAKASGADYLFFIDSDIVLHPKALKQLIADEKDIVSNVFWTKWGPNTQELPQVWMQDAYAFHQGKANQLITAEEIEEQNKKFLEKVKKPGVYEVGGLGACTLISKEALLRGVNFDDIRNVSFWGEDRHFCIRAVVLGLRLYVDTYYPAYHIYREKDLEGVSAYKEQGKKRDQVLLCEKLRTVITRAVERVLNYSYEDSGDSYLGEDFTEEERERQMIKLEEDRLRIRRQQIINNCEVNNIEFSFEEDTDKVQCTIEYVCEGYRRGYSYKENYEGDCRLERGVLGDYKINGLELGKRSPQKSPYIVRKITTPPHLTVSMCVKNEEGRYLEKVLKSAREYANQFIIIDDGSTDKTIQICEDLVGNKLKLIGNKESKFGNEVNLRKQQWIETISNQPDWLLFLDADEIFEERAKHVIPILLQERDFDAYAFRLYDFWNEVEYREDSLWDAHHSYRVFMMRYQRRYSYSFRETAQHCGRMPASLNELKTKSTDLRLKHYGWARAEDRLNKFKRYMKLDPEGVYGILEQYHSILDPHPNLVRWNEGSIEQ